MAHIGEKIKAYRVGKNIKQPELAETLNISRRTLQDIEKSGEIKSSETLRKITDIIEGVAQNNAQEPEQELISANKMDVDQNLSDLIYSNKTLAEAARIQAESERNRSERDKILASSHADLVSMLKKSMTDSDKQTLSETVNMILGLQEYLTEIAADVKKIPVMETRRELYSKVTAHKKRLEKKDTHAAKGT
jgi:transcriptional regulator with XRE-family HTH domain